MQKIYADPHGLDTWDAANCADVFIHTVSRGLFLAITGEQPPPTPISRAMYEAAGFGWVAVYDELVDIEPSPVLQHVKSLKID